MKITWKSFQPPAGPVIYKGCIGKWHIFTIKSSLSYNMSYALVCVLPGIKPVIGRFTKVGEAKDVAISIWEQWFKGLEEN